jgi:hypothetical protein
MLTARKIKKIRQAARYFLVRQSDGLFGSFEAGAWRWGIVANKYHRILAYSAEHAVERAQRKGIGKGQPIQPGSSEGFAHWKVKEEGKEKNKRMVSYF